MSSNPNLPQEGEHLGFARLPDVIRKPLALMAATMVAAAATPQASWANTSRAETPPTAPHVLKQPSASPYDLQQDGFHLTDTEAVIFLLGIAIGLFVSMDK